MDKICQYCGISYHIKPSLYAVSKFCSRGCHDKGKVYKKSGNKKEAAIKLRLNERLSVQDISSRLGISYSTAARYVKNYPLTREEQEEIRNKKLSEYVNKKWPISNRALFARLGVKVCEYIGCTWSETLEIHHIDGDKKNNARENIQVLCPNHHSITPNFRNRKRV